MLKMNEKTNNISKNIKLAVSDGLNELQFFFFNWYLYFTNNCLWLFFHSLIGISPFVTEQYISYSFQSEYLRTIHQNTLVKMKI